MIADIGLVVGAYVITRMVELLHREPRVPPGVALCAIATVLVTLFAVVDLFTKSADLTSKLVGP